MVWVKCLSELRPFEQEKSGDVVLIIFSSVLAVIFFLRGCRGVVPDGKDEIPFSLSSVYLRKTLTRVGLLVSLVHKVSLENLMGKEAWQEAARSSVGRFVTRARGLGGGHVARGCACFLVSASPALQADSLRRLGNNWTHASSRQSRPKRLTCEVYSCSFSYGSGHREAACPIHVQFDTTSRNCKMASCPLRTTEETSYLNSRRASVTES